MKLKVFNSIFCVMLAILPLTSCEKNDNNDPEPDTPVNPVNPDDPDDPDNPDSQTVMTPTAAFKYIKDTAVDALGRFNPEDQREILQVSKIFIETYGDYEMPDEFYDDPYYSPARVVGALNHSVRRKNPFGLTRASYDYSIAGYTGIYEPDPRREQWVRTGDSKSVIFRAPVNGQTVEICASPSGSDWILDADETVLVPGTLTTTVKWGTRVLASVTVKSNADIDRCKVSLDIVAEAANIVASVNIDGNNSRISETGRISVSGSTVVATETLLSGSGLCDIDSWGEDDDITEKLREATMSVNTLDRVYISAQCSDFSIVADGLDCWYDSYSGVSQDMAEKEVSKACDTINRNLGVDVKFAGSSAVQADLYWTPVIYNDYSYWEIYPGAAVRYAYDGSTELIESVDYNFNIVTDQFENLINRYSNFIRSLR